MTKPNVLVLMGDEHPVFVAGCYGDRVVRTPTLDALAAGGAVFDAAYCPSPICAPSRAAMMTGRHTSAIEVWDNASPLRCDWPTFAHAFRAAGYRTILCGKMHFVGPEQLHGFAERWVGDIYPPDFRWTRSNRAGVAVNDGQNIDRVAESGPGWTADMEYDEEVAFRAEHGLRRLARERAADPRPWLLVASFTGPHYPFRAPPAYFDRYRDEDIPLPRVPADFRAGEHEHVAWLRTHGRFDRLVDERTCRAARRATYARITMLDDYLARVLRALGERRASTVVAYLSDHGEMLGEHGLWFKNAAYEWSSRIPLIVAAPGVAPRRVDEAVSSLDLGPTLCGLAGVEPLYPMRDGRDLAPLLLGRRAADAGQAIMENYGEGVHRGWRMIRVGQRKLVWVPGCAPALYDLARDPGEWTDRAADPAYAAIRAELERRVLAGWDPAACDERRWQSEERRIALNRVYLREPPAWARRSEAMPAALG